MLNEQSLSLKIIINFIKNIKFYGKKMLSNIKRVLILTYSSKHAMSYIDFIILKSVFDNEFRKCF